MTLPIPLDYAAMEAKLVAELPHGEGWQFEPKWDGFRCLAFKDDETLALRSKSGQPLERYFPEVTDALKALPARRCVLDGELVVPVGDALSFDELLLRIHPAASRIAKLSRERPALYVAFDLLADERGGSLVDVPLEARWTALGAFARRNFEASATFRVSPATRSREDVDAWLAALGTGLDGVIAKRLALPYASGERTGMQKVKLMRTADCVVGGFRYGSKTKVVGSLLLGLFDEADRLHHVGFTSNLGSGDREALTRKLEALVAPPGFTGQAPGGPSRWSTQRSSEWQPLRTKLVVEVQYDHYSGRRFRHGTKFLRWRPDKAPRECTLAQVGQESAATLQLLDGGPSRRMRVSP